MRNNVLIPLDALFQKAGCVEGHRLRMEWDEDLEAAVYRHSQKVGDTLFTGRWMVPAEMDAYQGDLLDIFVTYVKDIHDQAVHPPTRLG